MYICTFLKCVKIMPLITSLCLAPFGRSEDTQTLKGTLSFHLLGMGKIIHEMIYWGYVR